MTVSSANQFGKVAVLFGGRSAEREISLMTGSAVLAGLRRGGVDAFGFDPAEKPVAELTGLNVDRVWLALHGRGGEDGVMQGALETLGIPYTGSGVLGSALAMDKLRSKLLFQAAGLATPKWCAPARQSELDAALEQIGLPCFVKPASEGSSVGTTKVTRRAQLHDAWAQARRSDPVVLVEELIDGPEYTAGVLGRDVLPLIHIETPRTFYDYQAKYFSERTLYHCPCGLDEQTEQSLAALSLTAFDALAASGWGRVDFMLDDTGVAQFLEVNTIPGMTSHSLVPQAAKVAGMDFDTLVWRVLETSMAEEPRS